MRYEYDKVITTKSVAQTEMKEQNLLLGNYLLHCLRRKQNSPVDLMT